MTGKFWRVHVRDAAASSRRRSGSGDERHSQRGDSANPIAYAGDAPLQVRTRTLTARRWSHEFLAVIRASGGTNGRKEGTAPTRCARRRGSFAQSAELKSPRTDDVLDGAPESPEIPGRGYSHRPFRMPTSTSGKVPSGFTCTSIRLHGPAGQRSGLTFMLCDGCAALKTVGGRYRQQSSSRV